MLGEAVSVMMVFPSGAWDLEAEFPDALGWLKELENVRPSSTLTQCFVGIRRLSSNITALGLPIFGSEDEDNDEEQDELEEEEAPVIAKIEKGSKKKSAPSADADVEENETPVSLWRLSYD